MDAAAHIGASHCHAVYYPQLHAAHDYAGYHVQELLDKRALFWFAFPLRRANSKDKPAVLDMLSITWLCPTLTLVLTF